MTEVLEKLIDLNLDVAKFRSLASKEGYPSNYPGLLNDQRRFFVRQAAYLSDKVRDAVSPYEYLVIAGAFDSIDFVDRADEYYKRASDTKVPDVDRAIALRGYGKFLFYQGRMPEGREKFRLALACVVGKSDRDYGFRGDTYERLAAMEDDALNPDAVRQYLERALQEYMEIKMVGRRATEVRRVSQRIADLDTRLSTSSANQVSIESSLPKQSPVVTV